MIEIGETTLVDVLRRRAIRHGERVALVHLLDGELRESSLTYGELDRRARALATSLAASAAPGERALLLHPQGGEFLVGFFGCLYAGIVAVPLFPPASARHLPRLRAVARDAGATLALATSGVLEGLRACAGIPDVAGLRCLATDSLDLGAADSWRRPGELGPDSLAFLQYTSGSTAAPRGVKISHGNLAHNERELARLWEHDERSVVVSWLPLYHDMGLVGCVLQAVYAGARCVLLSPEQFAQRPLRWLQAISHHRATTSGGPNSAYELCVAKITAEEKASLDLSSWAVAFNGAEPIRPATLERFRSAFAAQGFRPEALIPGYGLAESTLAVSTGARAASTRVLAVRASALEEQRVLPADPRDEGARVLAGCSRPIGGAEVAIVHPETLMPVGSGEIGEIWVASPSVGLGYWGREEESAAVFGATIAGGDGRAFLRTGDLGFLRDGEVFVTGRLKDLLIVRGRNHYPQDLEATVEASHAALRPRGSVAFSVEVGGEESAVVAAEVGRAFEPACAADVFDCMRRALAREHELRLHAAVLLRPGTLPKTTSGKPRRRSCRTDYLAGRLDAVAATEFRPRARGGRAPRTAIERDVAALWARVLGIDGVEADEDFFRLGGDSLRAAEVIAHARAAFGVELPSGALFERPTVEGLAAHIESLRGHAQAAAAPPLVASGPGEERVLSFAQQRLWFVDQLEPHGTLDSIPVRVRLEGPLDAARLERSLNALVRRHEALRTAYPSRDGRPIAVVAAAAALALSIAEARDESQAERLADVEARRPFELATGPLVRASLVRRSAREHDLLLTLHHIVADGWSVGVLLRELAELYEADLEGRAPALPELALQYADFAAWQRRRLDGPALGARQARWKERLAGAPVLDLPTDRPRPAVQSHRGARESLELPAELVSALEALGRRAGATLFMTLLAAFDVLLQRWSGQDDLCVGTVAAARERAELAGLIGLFANTLPLRVDLAGDPTFSELLARVRAVALGAFAQPDLPFEKIVDALDVPRSLGREPLVQALLTLQDAPPALSFGGLRATAVEQLERGAAIVDLSLSFVARDGCLSGTLEYATDLFERATARRLLAHLRAILETVAARPECRLAEIPLVSAGERRARLDPDRGETAASAACLHELFELQADRRPDATALVHGREAVSYGELEARANRLALRLSALCVRPGERVGLCLERSIDAVVAMLATLKSGGAYVPLDPAYPEERLAFLVEDSKPCVVVTRSELAPALPPSTAATILLDAEADALSCAGLARESTLRPSARARPLDLAYVIYTSGSTGRPKGVMVEHRGVVNAILAAVAAFEVGPGSRVAHLASTSFDASVLEIFTALAAGAELHVVARETVLAPESLALRLQEEGLTHLVAISPTLLASVPERPLPALATVIVGGEACGAETAARWSSGRRFLNAYGPTEASIYATVHAHPPGLRAPPAIGRPIRNACVHVLDARGEPVPDGIPGEAYLGGIGVARGYLGRAELTAERFVPDPFSSLPGARLYRTGDRARRRNDGELEYLGRLDDQVKIRGFRIELGEVEAALARHPALVSAAVDAREDAPGARRLVAYAVLCRGRSASASELRRFLATALPEHMLPSAFVFLDALPLTPNGKLDRRALPEPGAARPELECAFAEPRTPVERALAEIWAEVLHLERVGVHDNFFELGGDSILVVQVAVAARKAGLAVDPRHLFERQSIAELAGAVTAAPAARRAEPLPAGDAPLTPIQRWFFEHRFADAHHWNQALLLEVDRAIEPAVLEQALAAIAAHHDAFALRFTGDGASGLQVRRDGDGHAPFARFDLSALAPSARGPALEAATAELQASLDLAHGPLLRAAWFDLGQSSPARLFLVAHHLVVDAVSWRILLDDLSSACERPHGRGARDLAPRTTPFLEWARRLDAVARSGAVDGELERWSAGWGGVAPLPADFPGGEDLQRDARTVAVALGREETRDLLHVAATLLRARVDELLLAALADTLAGWTGSRRVLVDTESHGREPAVLGDAAAVDLTRTVGWFTSVFPSLFDLTEARAPEDALAVVKRRLRSTPLKGVGWGLLRFVRRADVLAALPAAGVLFNYLGLLDSALSSRGRFRYAAERVGPSRAPASRRTHDLELEASVCHGALGIEWTYGSARYRSATIEALAQRHLAALRALVEHGRTRARPLYEPADFADVALDRAALDRIVAAVSRVKGKAR